MKSVQQLPQNQPPLHPRSGGCVDTVINLSGDEGAFFTEPPLASCAILVGLANRN